MKRLSVSEVAETLGVSAKVVTAWIRSGELRAVDASATRGSKKPRWRITPDDLQAFERSRAAVPPSPPQKRRRKRTDVIQFFS